MDNTRIVKERIRLYPIIFRTVLSIVRRRLMRTASRMEVNCQVCKATTIPPVDLQLGFPALGHFAMTYVA